MLENIKRALFTATLREIIHDVVAAISLSATLFLLLHIAAFIEG